MDMVTDIDQGGKPLLRIGKPRIVWWVGERCGIRVSSPAVGRKLLDERRNPDINPRITIISR
jgi:hypothetical protein